MVDLAPYIPGIPYLLNLCLLHLSTAIIMSLLLLLFRWLLPLRSDLFKLRALLLQSAVEGDRQRNGERSTRMSIAIAGAKKTNLHRKSLLLALLPSRPFEVPMGPLQDCTCLGAFHPYFAFKSLTYQTSFSFPLSLLFLFAPFFFDYLRASPKKKTRKSLTRACGDPLTSPWPLSLSYSKTHRTPTAPQWIPGGP